MALTSREISRRWRENNPTGNRDKRRKYRTNHPIKARESVRKWAAANPEKRRANEHARRTRLSQAGGSYTVKEWLNLCNKYNHLCLSCLEEKVLTPDHIIPVSKGGSSNIENIQPLCGACNSRKGINNIDFRTIYEQRAEATSGVVE